MATDWIEVTVEDIKASIPNALVTGPFGSTISSKFFQDSGVPVIRGSNLSEDVGIRLIPENLAFVSEEKAEKLSRSIARMGDLVFTCWGTIGQVGLIDDRSPYSEYIVSNKQMKLTPDPELVDSLFLYYLFSGPEMLGRIQNQAIGSSVPGFNLGQLRALTLDLPPLDEQRTIAHILGSLDDKIELNRRMNATLEAMARAIFKSWFVDFDPVHAKACGEQPSGMDAATAALFPDSFEESELGMIPVGWRVGILGDIAENSRSSVQPEEIDLDTPYIGLEHMPQRSIALFEWGFAKEVSSNKYEFQEGDILFGKLRPYFHKVGVAPIDGVSSTDILVVTPTVYTWYGLTLFYLSSVEFVNYTVAASTGTRMPRTNWRDMSAYEIVIPPEDLALAFSELVAPLLDLMRTNIFHSRTLAELRDTLLPKLISGQVRVEDAKQF